MFRVKIRKGVFYVNAYFLIVCYTLYFSTTAIRVKPFYPSHEGIGDCKVNLFITKFFVY